MLAGFWALTKQSFNEWLEDKASRLAASLAFYTMLSIAPLLVIAIKVIGWIFGEDAARGGISQYLAQTVGSKGAQATQEIIKHAGQSGAGTFATIVSMVILLFSASGVFGELQDALDTIWEVKPRPDRGWMDIFRERFFSFALVLGVIFLLLVTLVINTVLAALTHALGGEQILWQAVNFVVSMAVIVCLFALIFKYLPDAEVRWRYVWIGAIVTGVLFTIGKFILAWYLGRATTTSVYGAAGSLVALLIWVYYSGQILFFGGEFTQVYAKLHGRGVRPTANAVAVTENERAQQGIPHQPAANQAAESTPPQPAQMEAIRFSLPQRPSRWLLATVGTATGAALSGLTVHLAEREPGRIQQSRRERQIVLDRINRVRADVKSLRRFKSMARAKDVNDRIDAIERRINRRLLPEAGESTLAGLWLRFMQGWRQGRTRLAR